MEEDEILDDHTRRLVIARLEHENLKKALECVDNVLNCLAVNELTECSMYGDLCKARKTIKKAYAAAYIARYKVLKDETE